MIDILMPRLSDTMTEGAIAAWHKQPGDAVSPGDLLVEIETDKALMEQEAYEAGTLAEILVQVGENVPIGTPIARLDDGREPDASAPRPAAAASDPDPARRAASPLVRRIARERGLELADIPGSGPGGRIVRADLDSAGSPSPTDTLSPTGTPSPTGSLSPSKGTPPNPTRSTTLPFDAVRRTIAARLTESATTVPSFTATASADVEEMLELRARLNAAAPDDPRISVNDLLVRAVALALREHPGVNASYTAEGGGGTVLHDGIHLGIAVASPAGLVVPVVRDADRLAVRSIARTSRELGGRAAARSLAPKELADGTFTISNLGMYGVEHFTAIINPPQGAILAVGAARPELALVDGAVVARRRLRYTLTADHRIIDGALAAEFLATLTSLLEHPLRVLA